MKRQVAAPELAPARVADLRAGLAQAEAASALPAGPDVAGVEALVVDLQRRALGDVRFNPVARG